MTHTQHPPTHRTTSWFTFRKDAQWNTLQCWMLWNKTKFQYINLEVAALQTLTRDWIQVNFNMSLYLRRYCNYFSQELWWDFFELWYFYSCNCSTIHKLHIKCPSSVNNFYLKEESKSIILRLKTQQWHTHDKKFHGNYTFRLSWTKWRDISMWANCSCFLNNSYLYTCPFSFGRKQADFATER